MTILHKLSAEQEKEADGNEDMGGSELLKSPKMYLNKLKQRHHLKIRAILFCSIFFIIAIVRMTAMITFTNNQRPHIKLPSEYTLTYNSTIF